MISGDIDLITKLAIRRQDTGEELHLAGREAWCLAHLIDVGSKGITSLERPAPRWSGYIHKLRHLRRLPIERQDESHGGPYSGAHGRYFLRASVEIIDQQYQVRAV